MDIADPLEKLDEEAGYGVPVAYSFTLKETKIFYIIRNMWTYFMFLWIILIYLDSIKGTNYLLEKERKKKLKKQLIDAIKEKDKILEEISLISDEDPDKLNLESELKALIELVLGLEPIIKKTILLDTRIPILLLDTTENILYCILILNIIENITTLLRFLQMLLMKILYMVSIKE